MWLLTGDVWADSGEWDDSATWGDGGALISADGALQAQPALVGGNATTAVVVYATGALQAQSVALAGAGEYQAIKRAAGALQAQAAVVAGEVTSVSGVVSSSADIGAAPAKVSGSAKRTVKAQGALMAGPASIDSGWWVEFAPSESNWVRQ